MGPAVRNAAAVNSACRLDCDGAGMMDEEDVSFDLVKAIEVV
jgi:hypothetical protein